MAKVMVGFVARGLQDSSHYIFGSAEEEIVGVVGLEAAGLQNSSQSILGPAKTLRKYFSSESGHQQIFLLPSPAMILKNLLSIAAILSGLADTGAESVGHPSRGLEMRCISGPPPSAPNKQCTSPRIMVT